jgi:hypothetical protein
VAFADGLLAGLPALDILINNAAQTVRRTPDDFAEAEALERMGIETLPANIRPILGVDPLLELPGEPGPSRGAGATSLGLIRIPNPLDQPPDHREAKSWTARLADVGPIELLKVDADEASIVHPEHDTITLPRGVCRVWRQREFDDLGSRFVAD